MPRKIGYGSFTPARRAALRKAQLESARKRRKHFSDETPHRRKKKQDDSDKRRRRKKQLILAGAVAAASVGVGAAVYASRAQQGKNQSFTADNPMSFDLKDMKQRKEAIKVGKSLTTQHRDDWIKNDPENGLKHFEAIKGYTSEGLDASIGYYLREGKSPYGQQISQFQDEMDMLDSAFDSPNVTPTSDWMQVSRGTSLEEFSDLVPGQIIQKGLSNDLETIKSALVGKEVVNKSFTSTTLGDPPAFSAKGVHIVFKLPPGIRGLYTGNNMKSKPGEDKNNFLSVFPHEGEMILRKGLKYKITDVKQSSGGFNEKRFTVVAEVAL